MELEGKKDTSLSSGQPVEKIDYLSSKLWLPPTLLLLILLTFLIYLLIPGTLIYPKVELKSHVFGDNQAQINSEVEQSLRLRAEELELAINTGTCSGGQFEIPDDAVSILPPSNDSNVNKRPLIIPPASQLAAQFSGENLSLEDLIRKSTVLIISGEGENVSSGTGFFINNNFIVTNAHVVENGGQNILAYIDGKKRPIAVSLKNKSTSFKSSGRDYAVLMSSEPSNFFLTFQNQEGSLQLESVIAAGFPGDAIELLADLHQSENSDEPGKLPLFITTGVVNAEQKIKATEDAIVHSAAISQGNSGGPLTNACGRVLGINTFISTSEVRTLNIALSVSGLGRFLNETGTAFEATNEICSPRLVPKDPTSDQ